MLMRNNFMQTYLVLMDRNANVYFTYVTYVTLEG